jgi:hypothetical protein
MRDATTAIPCRPQILRHTVSHTSRRTSRPESAIERDRWPVIAVPSLLLAPFCPCQPGSGRPGSRPCRVGCGWTFPVFTVAQASRTTATPTSNTGSRLVNTWRGDRCGDTSAGRRRRPSADATSDQTGTAQTTSTQSGWSQRAGRRAGRRDTEPRSGRPCRWRATSWLRRPPRYSATRDRG